MWKRLEHKNIVPLLGITPTPLQLISDWMPGGDLTEYIKNNPGVDRPDLVGTLPLDLIPTLTLATSCPMLLKVFTSSTPAILSMVISREYAITLNPLLLLY